MSKIKLIMFETGAYPLFFSLKSYCRFFGRELKGLGLIALLISSALVLRPDSASFAKNYFLDILSHYQASLEGESVFSQLQLPGKNLIATNSLAKNKTAYSYQETQSGFDLEDFAFFEKAPQATVEKNILKLLPRNISQRAKRYVRAVLKISEKHQVDPVWVLSVMWTESHFKFKAHSHAGAKGLMQIMPGTKKYVYHTYARRGRKLIVEQESFNIDNYFPYKIKSKDFDSHVAKLINIELGIIYLKRLLNHFDNHIHATVAYNMGPSWTRDRLRNSLPVGVKNQYLAKVRKAYKSITKRI